MRDSVVAMGNMVVGRMIAGVLNLSSSHPVALCVLLATLAALVSVTWLDLMGVRLDTLARPKHEKPIRPRRS